MKIEIRLEAEGEVEIETDPPIDASEISDFLRILANHMAGQAWLESSPLDHQAPTQLQ